MKSQFPSLLARGERHTAPDKEKDINRLVDVYVKGEIFATKSPRRKFKGGSDHAKDVVTEGVVDLTKGGAFGRWWDNRSFKRSAEESWPMA